MSDSRGDQQAFEVMGVSCEKHPDYWNVPGSLLAEHLEYLLDSLPPEALVREFQIHMKELS